MFLLKENNKSNGIFENISFIEMEPSKLINHLRKKIELPKVLWYWYLMWCPKNKCTNKNNLPHQLRKEK
jgi:hypothetical protein